MKVRGTTMAKISHTTFFNAEPLLSVSGLTRGTLIQTANGPQPIETLQLGDMVETENASLQPLRSLSRQKMLGSTSTYPVLIAAGVIGNRSAMIVAPMQRVVSSGPKDEPVSKQLSALVEARHLVNGTTVTRGDTQRIEYLNLGFDAPQMIVAQGALVESDLPHTAGTFT